MSSDQHLDTGRAALAYGRWDEAVAAFENALAVDQTGDALAGLGEAWWWLGRNRVSIQTRERAFAAYLREDNPVAACSTGITLSISYLINLGNAAAAHGWLAKAERTMESAAPNPMQGWLWLLRGFLTSDPATSQELFERALENGRDNGDIDLELIARSDLGLCLVSGGKPDEGLVLLDEALAGSLAGEGRRLDTVVFTSCNMLTACQMTGDLDRASQWCRAADEFMQRFSCPFMFATCRAHYGAVLLAKGQWEQAERELLAALRIGEEAGPGARQDAMVWLAELRVRQGRSEEAEALMSELPDPVAAAIPAARARLLAGEPAMAVALLEQRAADLDAPSPARASILALLVDALIADDRHDSATEASVALECTAEALQLDRTTALVEMARAHLASAAGRDDEAQSHLRAGLRLFTQLELPYEAAGAQLERAHSLARSDPAAAIIDARNARATFDRLGARSHADAAAALLRSLGAGGRTGPRAHGPLTQREQEVLQLIAAGLSNPEIAERLYISRKTASHHVSRILMKLGVRNRTEAAAYAARAPSRARLG